MVLRIESGLPACKVYVCSRNYFEKCVLGPGEIVLVGKVRK